MRIGIASVAFCFFLLAVRPCGGIDLRAGAASSTITPDVGRETVYMAGFGHNRVAAGVHDDLYARCLALSTPGQVVVLCSVDLIGLFYDDVAKIRALFSRSASPGPFLIVASTHVHEGPDTLGLWGPSATQSGVSRSYLDWVCGRVAETAVRALNSLEPAYLELARDDHPLLAQLQSVDRPPYVHDPFLFVMRVVAASNRATIATVVNWSDHPETLDRGNLQITSDYAHWVRTYLETKFGGLAIFFNGSIGKVSSLGADVAIQDPETGKTAEDGTWRKAELLGTTVGRLAERVLLHPTRADPDSITLRTAVVFVPLANERFRVAEALDLLLGRKPLYSNGRLDQSVLQRDVPEIGTLNVPTGHELQAEVDYLQFRKASQVLAEFVTVPGEIYPELVNGGITRYAGADYPDAPFEPTLRAHFKSQYQFILGLGNDELGYLIPKAEWDSQPPWLQNRPHSWYGEINSVGPDAAGVVAHALVALMQ